MTRQALETQVAHFVVEIPSVSGGNSLPGKRRRTFEVLTMPKVCQDFFQVFFVGQEDTTVRDFFASFFFRASNFANRKWVHRTKGEKIPSPLSSPFLLFVHPPREQEGDKKRGRDSLESLI